VCSNHQASRGRRILKQMSNLPSGTVTFLFSDIEGSTELLKQLGDMTYEQLLRDHRRLLREIFDEHDGREIDTQGDAFFYSFPRARDAVVAAAHAQKGMASHSWPNGVDVRVRMGLHTGEPAVGNEGYTGLDVVRAARIAAVGKGGQVLLSETTRALVGDHLPEGVSARSIGSQRLKDIDRPEPLHELLVNGASAAPDSPKRVTREPNARSSDTTGAYEELAEHARLAIEQRVLTELKQAFGNLVDEKPPSSD
jgi:class 3 adenylate cyclase